MSTGLVLGAVGALIGAPLGLAQVGFVIGSTIGNLVDAPDGPSPGDLSAPDIQEGHQLVRPYGTVPLTAHPVSVSDYTATANETGGKGGPPEGSAGYTYTLDVLGVIAHRVPSMPIIAVTRVWVNKKLVQTFRADSTSGSLVASAATDAYTSLTLFPGGSAQMPPPEYETRVGTANASAYRNCATVEIIGLNCGGSKTPPLVEVEVITAGTRGATDDITRLRFDGASTSDIGCEGGAGALLGLGAISGGEFVGSPSNNIDGARLRWSGSRLGRTVSQPWKLVFDVRWAGLANITNNIVLSWSYTDTTFTFRRVLLSFYSNTGELRLSSAASISGGYIAMDVTSRVEVNFDGATTWRMFIAGVLIGSYTSPDNGSLGGETLTIGPEYNADGDLINLFVDNVLLTYEQGNTANYTPDDLPANSCAMSSWTPAVVDLQDIVDAELAMNSAISAADHDTTDLAGVTVRGFKATGPAGKTIAELGEIFYFDCVPGAPIRYQMRGTSTVATILNADTGAGVNEAGEPFTGLKVANDIERASVVGLSAPNASADHEPVFRRGDRQTTEGPDVRKVRTEVELTPAETQGRALAMSLMERASSQTAEFGVSDKFAAAEPGDVYSAYDDQGNLYSLMIRSLTYADGVRQTKWELNDTSALVETGITDGNYTPSLIVVAPVDSNLVAIDGPIMQDADDDPGAYTAIEGEGTANYPGGVVRRSVDDLDFTEVATTHSAESVVGVASTALGNWTGGYVWDELNSVTVVVGEGQSLASSTEAAMQANRAINSAFLGAHGRWEVIRFRTATLGAALTYTLTGLLRGMRGTERHMGAHVIGDTFVLATTAGLRRMTGEVATMGATRYLKAVTSGRPAASATSEAFVNTAVGLRPFSPTDLMASRDGSANITFTIRHRPRLFPRYGGSGGSYIPPSSGAFEMDVYSTSGYTTILRTLTSTDGTFTYSAANQTADFGSTQATVYTESFEVSPTYGRGSALRASA